MHLWKFLKYMNARNVYNTQKYIKYPKISTYSNEYLVDETHLFHLFYKNISLRKYPQSTNYQ